MEILLEKSKRPSGFLGGRGAREVGCGCLAQALFVYAQRLHVIGCHGDQEVADVFRVAGAQAVGIVFATKGAQILRPGMYIFSLVEAILDTEARGCRWHELHQPDGQLRGYRPRIKP